MFDDGGNTKADKSDGGTQNLGTRWPTEKFDIQYDNRDSSLHNAENDQIWWWRNYDRKNKCQNSERNSLIQSHRALLTISRAIETIGAHLTW